MGKSSLLPTCQLLHKTMKKNTVQKKIRMISLIVIDDLQSKIQVQLHSHGKITYSLTYADLS